MNWYTRASGRVVACGGQSRSAGGAPPSHCRSLSGSLRNITGQTEAAEVGDADGYSTLLDTVPGEFPAEPT